MTITEAEHLQRDLTDKYVVVQDNVPELKRFEGLTGVVKTVNMSGRALVEFDGPVDIGWYDIDPAYLTVVDKPLPKKKAEDPKPQKPAAKPNAAPAAKGGGSPLDLIRKQGAAGGGSADKDDAPAGGGKPSPLDLIRKQGAAKPAAEEEAKESAPEEDRTAQAPASGKPAAPPSGMSPIDLIRQQGAAKR